MTKEMFKSFVDHKLDDVDLHRVTVESYSTTKELVSEMERMCQALADYCEEHKYALQLARASLVIQGYFPGMDKKAPEGAGTVGFIWGSGKSVQKNIADIVHTHMHAQPHVITGEEE